MPDSYYNLHNLSFALAGSELKSQYINPMVILTLILKYVTSAQIPNFDWQVYFRKHNPFAFPVVSLHLLIILRFYYILLIVQPRKGKKSKLYRNLARRP